MISRDLLWKGIVKDFFRDFVFLFFPASARRIDWSKGFDFLEQEMAQLAHDSKSSRRVVDLLVKVHLLNGTEEWFLIHIEIQGYVDEHFAERMFIYFYRIRDKFHRKVSQLALLTDDDEDFHPTKYVEKSEHTQTTHKFGCFKLAKKKAEDFQDRRNIFNIVLETAWLGLAKNRKDDNAVFNHAMQLKRRLLEGGFPKDKIRKVLQFLEHYVTFGKPEFKEKLSQEIHQTKEAMGIEEIIIDYYQQEARQEGIQEGEKLGIEKGEKLGIEKGEKLGIEKGKQEGVRFSIQKMLEKGFEVSIVADVLGVELQVVREVEQKLKNQKQQGKNSHAGNGNT